MSKKNKKKRRIKTVTTTRTVVKTTLGATDDVHDHQAKEGQQVAARALADVEDAARQGNCASVWDNLLIARANLSHAYAHLSSSSTGAAQEMFKKHLGLQTRLTSLRDTLGFQCTKRLGKRR